jgi:tryptophan synthase alpha chain
LSRIEKTFAALKRPALITFVTAGDPDKGLGQKILDSLPESGADIIELGMPFTDPMADGASIQAANLRALKAGASMQQTFDMVQQFRSHNKTTPLVLMGYYNPVLAYGPKGFVQDAAKAGVDGLILVDLPPEEDSELRQFCSKASIDLIRLITPTTDEARLKILLQGAGGFLYYVSITGITGAAKPDPAKVATHIAEIKKHTKLPIAAGFGVKTPQDVTAIARTADAVVVGSALVDTIGGELRHGNLNPLIDKVKSLSAALQP